MNIKKIITVTFAMILGLQCVFTQKVRKLEYQTLIHIQMCRICTTEMLMNEPNLVSKDCHDKNYNDTSYPWCVAGKIPTCPPFPDDKNGKVIYELDYQKNAVYRWVKKRCSVGYLTNGTSLSQKIYCQDDYSWSEEIPQCKKNACPDPFLEASPNDTFSYVTNGIADFGIGCSINFTCVDGYHTTDGVTITCLQNEIWSGGVPKCQKVLPQESLTTEGIIGIVAGCSLCILIIGVICCVKRKPKKKKYRQVPTIQRESGDTIIVFNQPPSSTGLQAGDNTSSDEDQSREQSDCDIEDNDSDSYNSNRIIAAVKPQEDDTDPTYDVISFNEMGTLTGMNGMSDIGADPDSLPKFSEENDLDLKDIEAELKPCSESTNTRPEKKDDFPASMNTFTNDSLKFKLNSECRGADAQFHSSQGEQAISKNFKEEGQISTSTKENSSCNKTANSFFEPLPLKDICEQAIQKLLGYSQKVTTDKKDNIIQNGSSFEKTETDIVSDGERSVVRSRGNHAEPFGVDDDNSETSISNQSASNVSVPGTENNCVLSIQDMLEKPGYNKNLEEFVLAGDLKNQCRWSACMYGFSISCNIFSRLKADHIWDGKKGANNFTETATYNVLQEMVQCGWRLGHLMKYFSQEETIRCDLIKLIWNIHKNDNCDYCKLIVAKCNLDS